MPYFGGLEADEREMLYDLINTFIDKLNVQRRLNEDLSRRLDAANARLRVLDAVHYGSI